MIDRLFSSVIFSDMSEGEREMDFGVSDEEEYEKAVCSMESGDESAKTKVAFFKLSGRGGVEVDADSAVALLEERVKDKDAEAKWMLGLCCEYGMGTEQDIKSSSSLYKESYEEGNIVGEFLWKNGYGGRGSGVMITETHYPWWCL